MLIKVPGMKKPPTFNKDRRDPTVVLGIMNPGASARGNSYWKLMRSCPREHALQSIVGLRREGDQEALTVGLTFHHALEVYYRCIQAHQYALGTTAERPDIASPEYFWGATEAAEKLAWKSIDAMASEPGYEDTYAELERMLASYFDCHRRTDKWRILAVEETLEYADEGRWRSNIDIPGGREDTQTAGPMEYSARLDLIVEDYSAGGMWIVEHKTARSITEDLLSGYQMDQQILGQAWLLRACVDLTRYPALRGVNVNITSKHKTPKHERCQVMPSRRHLAAFEGSMRSWNALKPAFEHHGWPKALGNCSGPAHYFKKCPYFDVCHGQPEASVADLVRADAPLGYVKTSEA
jgi:hypothetical protein